MKKFLIKFFLSLYILLLGGYSQLHAHASHNYADHSPRKLSEASENTSADTEALALIIKPASSDKEKEISKLEATEVREEEDEHESDSSRKNLKNTTCFITILSVPAIGHFFCDKSVPFSKYHPYSTSYRYLILQVFRI